MAEFDVVLIAAGHDGHVAPPTWRERLSRSWSSSTNRVGGACVAEKIAPGFKVSGDSTQFFSFRPPLPEWANYRVPVRSLCLCGAGAHPEGRVSAAP